MKNFALAACGSEESKDGSKQKKEEKIDQTEVKSQLLDFQEEIVDVLKVNHKPFAEFEALTLEENEEARSEADELFTSFEEKLGKIFEDVDLLAPNIKKEIK